MRTLALLTLTFGVVLAHGAGAAGRAYAAEDVDTPRLVRVRSQSPEVTDIIRRASETSATFRQLMAAIDGTDGLIYVDDGKCGHGVQACLLLHVQVAGPFRILHVRIDAHTLDCRLMASIGHELQHAIEVLSDPSVTNATGAYFFFDNIRHANNGRFETEAALRTGDQVRHEACSVKGQ